MFLALKEIKKEKLRFLMIILVTALIAYLIYFLSSLAYELAQLNRTAVDHWQSKGIILNEASNMNIYASSINEAEVEEFDLSNSININTASIQTNDESELVDVVFLGVENDNDSIIAPIVEGRIYENEHEMVISNNIRNEYDL